MLEVLGAPIPLLLDFPQVPLYDRKMDNNAHLRFFSGMVIAWGIS